MAEAEAVMKLREDIAKEGDLSFIRLGKIFRELDDGDWQLTKDELKQALSQLGIKTSDADLANAIRQFDKGGDGKINHQEFIEGIMSPISDTRKALVTKAFAKADKTGDGVITIADLRGSHDVSGNFDFIIGRKTEEQLFNEFLEELDEPGKSDGKITAQEFMIFYIRLSETIQDDAEFKRMINSTWHL